jgi:hypothetical protein
MTEELMTEPNEFFDEDALFTAVENQLADGHPAVVKATLMRLRMTVFSQERPSSLSPALWRRRSRP